MDWVLGVRDLLVDIIHGSFLPSSENISKLEYAGKFWLLTNKEKDAWKIQMPVTRGARNDFDIFCYECVWKAQISQFNRYQKGWIMCQNMKMCLKDANHELFIDSKVRVCLIKENVPARYKLYVWHAQHVLILCALKVFYWTCVYFLKNGIGRTNKLPLKLGKTVYKKIINYSSNPPLFLYNTPLISLFDSWRCKNNGRGCCFANNLGCTSST